MTALPPIPLENATPLALVRRHPEKARALAEAAADTFGTASRIAARLLAPGLDRVSRDWLARQHNPYLPEIDAMATLLGIRGVYALNACFEWGCTGGIWPSPQGPVLRRVLDWPFPRLGESTMVCRQEQERFFNIGWPGFAGVVQGLAPGRFAAAINQAPMRRHGKGYVGDWLANRILVRGNPGLPPAHLLRSIFETAPDYQAAKRRLCEDAIAIPAIFLLAGPDQGCVIERTETAFAVREMGENGVCAANHFELIPGGWRPRPIDSAGRASAAGALPADSAGFDWFTAPIANPNSRLVFNATAAGSLALMGTRGTVPTTRTFVLPH